MERTQRLLKNTLIYSIGNFGSKFLNFLLIPLFSFYLSKAELGYFDLVVVTASLVIPFITFQLSDSVYRWLLDSGNEGADFSRIVSSSLSIIIGNIVIGSALFGVYLLFFKLEYSLLLWLYFISMCLQPYFQQLTRGLRMNKLYATAGILNAVVLVVCNLVLLVVFKMGVPSLFISVIAANMLTVFYIILKIDLHKYLAWGDISRKYISELVKYSVPLIPNVMSWWMIGSANRYIILHFLGQDSNGVYGLANRFPAILVIVNSVFNLSWQESAITEFHSDHRDQFYTNVFRKFYILEMTSVILFIVFSRLLVKYAVSPNFYEAWEYLPMLYLAVAFSSFSSFLGTGYLSSKNTIGAFTTTVLGAVVNIVVSVILVPKIGLQGAAIGTTLGFLATWIARIVQTRKYFHIALNLAEVGWLLGLSILAIISVFYLHGTVSMILMIAGAFLVFFYYNKNLIRSLVMNVAKKIPVLKVIK